jgi:hypothetical protein
MRIVSYLRGQTVKTYKPNHGFGFLPDAIKALAERYDFQVIPSVKDLVPTAENPAGPPATFQHGKLESDERTIVITELQIYAMGLVVTTHTPTRDTDRVADDVIQWATAQFDLVLEPIKPTAHSTQLEVRFERPLPELLPELTPMGHALTETLEHFWESRSSYEVSGLYFTCDPLKATKFAPPLFRIERRADIPYEMNLYFCEAPLSTDNTIAVLEQFESACLARSR